MPDDADQGVRHLVLVHGRAKARTMVEPAQKKLVDIAAEVLSDEDGKIGISYSGFCLTGLPHKQLPEDQAWEKRGHRVTLMVEPGRRGGGKGGFIGVPYGARARMILLYLQTEAIRTGSREVELGPSMHSWLGRMGRPGAARPASNCASKRPGSQPATCASPGKVTPQTDG